MVSIKIFMKSGKVREFPHQGRAGGSYTKQVRYEPGFVVVKDEWGDETAIPTAEIAEVKVENLRSS